MNHIIYFLLLSCSLTINSQDLSNENHIKETGQQLTTKQKTVDLADFISKRDSKAKLYFIQPLNAMRLPKTFKVIFGLSNMGVAPAGIDIENTGHHHLLINLDSLPDLTKPLPANSNIIHFGKGETETKITLEPGTHTLQLLLGNYLHIPHNKPLLSQKITVRVR